MEKKLLVWVHLLSWRALQLLEQPCNDERVSRFLQPRVVWDARSPWPRRFVALTIADVIMALQDELPLQRESTLLHPPRHGHLVELKSSQILFSMNSAIAMIARRRVFRSPNQRGLDEQEHLAARGVG
jgi:hypothetical protein